MSYPPVFGPPTWDVVHLTCVKYDTLDQKAHANVREDMKKFWEVLPVILLCADCGRHCKAYIQEHPPPFETANKENREMFRWSVDFHNAVNRRTGKREWTFEEADEHIKKRFYDIKDWVERKRADEMRREDHEYIDQLLQELEKAGLRPPKRRPKGEAMRDETQNTTAAKTSTEKVPTGQILVAITVIILVIVLMCFFFI